MVEVTLIAPTGQVQTVGAGGQQTSSATQTGVPSSAPLSPGAILSGIITGKDAGGSYLLKTDQGVFNLHSTTPLTYNSDVLIRVDSNNGNNAAARIISVNGEAYSTFSAPITPEADSLSPALLAKTATQAGGPQAAATSDAAIPTPKFSPVPAVTVPTPPTTGSPAPQAPIPVGTPVVLHPTAQAANEPVAAPAIQATVAPSPSAASQPVATAPSTIPAQQTTQTTIVPTTTPQASQTPSVTTTAGQATPATTPAATPVAPPEALPANVAKLIVAQPTALAGDNSAPSSFFTKPAVPTPQAPVVQNALYAAYSKSAPPSLPVATSPTALPTLDANILASHEDGALTLLTPQGTLTVKPESLPLPLQLPAGTPLTVSLPASFAPPLLTDANVLEDSVAATLKQVLSLVQQKSPSAANELLAKLPSVGADFLSSSVTFLSALLQGNARKILGDTTLDTLSDTDKNTLLAKFSGQLASVAQSFQKPAEGAPHPAPSWQSLVLPYVYNGAIQEARIYVKRDAPRKAREDKKLAGDTRFIIEVTFSDLGELQLDGIVLPKEKATVFDLIVRTQVAFTPDEKQDIMRIYKSAAELTGFKGSIGFTVAKDFPVRPLAEMNTVQPRDIIA